MNSLVAGTITAALSSILASFGTYAAIRVAERKKAEDEARQKCIMRVFECHREAGHLAGYLMQRDMGVGRSREWTERYRNCWQQFRTAITDLEKLLIAAPASGLGRVRRARVRMAAWLGRSVNFEDDVREMWGWLPKAFYGFVPTPEQAWQIPSMANHDVMGLRAIEEQIRHRLPRGPNDTLPEPIQHLLEEKEWMWRRALVTAEDNFYNELIGSIGDRQRFTELLDSQIRFDGASRALARLGDDIAKFERDLLWLAVAFLDITDGLPAADPTFDKLCDLAAAAYQLIVPEDRLAWVGKLADATTGDSGIVGMLDRAEALSMPKVQIEVLEARINKVLARAKTRGGEIYRKRQALRILKWWNAAEPVSASEWAIGQLSGHPRDAYDFLNVFCVSTLEDSGKEQFSFDLESAVAFVRFEILDLAIEELAFGPLAPEARPLVLAFRRTSTG